MKTGFTCDAGYNLAATATRNGHTLLVVVLGRTSSSDRAELAARLLDGAFSAKPADVPSTLLASFTDTASDPGPIDMRICSGSGVDRVGFSDSVLGPVVAVTDPVKVVTDNPPPPATASKSTSSKSGGTQSASSGDRSPSKISSSASASKGGDSSTASKGSSSSKGAVSASTKSAEAFAAAASAAAIAPLEDQSARDRVFKVFAADD
jgi:D-alanyl-D-alanine carboxypeptidase